VTGVCFLERREAEGNLCGVAGTDTELRSLLGSLNGILRPFHILFLDLITLMLLVVLCTETEYELSTETQTSPQAVLLIAVLTAVGTVLVSESLEMSAADALHIQTWSEIYGTKALHAQTWSTTGTERTQSRLEIPFTLQEAFGLPRRAALGKRVSRTDGAKLRVLTSLERVDKIRCWRKCLQECGEKLRTNDLFLDRVTILYR